MRVEGKIQLKSDGSGRKHNLYKLIFFLVVGVQTLSEDLKDDLLKEHNDRRSEVSDPEATDMQMLSWDDELAKVAEANVK